jgi:hypothetical protein
MKNWRNNGNKLIEMKKTTFYAIIIITVFTLALTFTYKDGALFIKTEDMEKGIYKGIEIEYRGFKIDETYLFTILDNNETIYLSEIQLKNVIWKKNK